MRYFHYSLITILYLGAISPVIADHQKVGGIEIDYPEAFERIEAGAEQRTGGINYNSLAVYTASIPTRMRLTLASGGIDIARLGFESAEPIDLDSVARQMIAGQMSRSEKTLRPNRFQPFGLLGTKVADCRLKSRSRA